MCSEEVSNAINLYFAILIIISFVMYSTLLLVLIKIRRSFHPFFSTLFGLVILCYQICAAGVATQRIIYLIFGYGENGLLYKGCSESCLQTLTMVLICMDYIVNCSYAAITALFLSCLIERIVATLASKKYEHSRFWGLLIALLLFTAGVIYVKGVQNYVILGLTEADQYIMIGLSVTILAMLFLLFVTNMRRIKSNDRISNNSLSYKYQLTENLRVVRNALIPVVLLDTSITINDIVGEIAFQKEFIFVPKNCNENHAYPYAFVIMNTFSLALEFAIPLVILCRWDAFHKALPICLRIRESGNKIHNRESQKVIHNVFGKQINHQLSAQNYFDILQKDWNKF